MKIGAIVISAIEQFAFATNHKVILRTLISKLLIA